MKKVIATCIAVLSPSVVWAAGTQLPVHGVRALSVGGALTAGASGTDALWHNPALLNETTVSLSVSFIDLQATYTPLGADPASVQNSATPVPNPQVGIVYKASDSLSLAFGAYAPFGAQYKFPEDGPQRYALVKNNRSAVIFFHAAAAYRYKGLSVGAGVQNVYAHVQQISVLSGYTGLFGFPEDPELDVLSGLEIKDPLTITGNLGASYEMGSFTFGASAQLPYTVSGDATFVNRLPSSVFFDPTELQGDEAYIEVPHPLMVRVGAQYRPTSRIQLEAAVKYEGWSAQERVQLDPQGRITLGGVPAIGNYRIGTLTIDRRMRDVISVHLGGDVEVIEKLHLRAGTFYEPSAFDDETFSVATLDDDKIGVSVGVSWHYASFRFDLAAARIFQGERNVTTSELTQVNTTNPSQASIIGNGTYVSNFWVAGAGLAWVYE